MLTKVTGIRRTTPDGILVQSYCTSVGAYYGYDEKKQESPYMIVCKHAYEKNVRFEHLDIVQFIIWTSCHERIVGQEKMFEQAYKLFLEYKEEHPSKHYTPLLLAAQELERRGLIYVSDEYDPEMGMQEVCTNIYPVIASTKQLDGKIHLKLKGMQRFKDYFEARKLKGVEKNLYCFLQENPGSSFLEYYISSIGKRNNVDLIGQAASALMEKGLVLPIGWTVPMPVREG